MGVPKHVIGSIDWPCSARVSFQWSVPQNSTWAERGQEELRGRATPSATPLSRSLVVFAQAIFILQTSNQPPDPAHPDTLIASRKKVNMASMLAIGGGVAVAAFLVRSSYSRHAPPAGLAVRRRILEPPHVCIVVVCISNTCRKTRTDSIFIRAAPAWSPGDGPGAA